MSRFRKPRFELFGRSLSGRVLWLTVSIIMLVELVILMPSLGRERQTWLWDHVTRAHLAAVAASQSGDIAFDPATRDMLLRLSDTEAIRLDQPGQLEIVLAPDAPLAPTRKIALETETLAYSTWRAEVLAMGLGDSRIEIVSPSPLEPSARLDIVVNGDELAAYLRLYAQHIAVLSVIIALVTGLLVFAALDRQLVRPMRIMTESIVGFRKDPEHDGQSGLAWLAARRDDEISGAARELKTMQDEMRAALWRNARLAAVGTAVAKISHDLRNILSSALLVADRLQETSDPVAKRAANTLIPAVERAAQLVSRTVDFAREGPPPVTRTAVVVRDLVEETAQVVRPDGSSVEIENLVPPELVLALDRTHIFRVLLNLMRNAVEAGAQKITLSVSIRGGVTRLAVRDNGPGLPLRVQDNLFKPFTGSGRNGGTGLGLAIARDLIRAHGGDLTLAKTGMKGTEFVMELSVSELLMPEANRAGFRLPPLVEAATEPVAPEPAAPQPAAPEPAAPEPVAAAVEPRAPGPAAPEPVEAAPKAAPKPRKPRRRRAAAPSTAALLAAAAEAAAGLGAAAAATASEPEPEAEVAPAASNVIPLPARAARKPRRQDDKIANPIEIEGVPTSRNLNE